MQKRDGEHIAMRLGRLTRRLIDRWQRGGWILGFILPLLVVGLIAAARRMPWLEMVRPGSWVMAGRREFVLLGLAALLMMGTLASRLKGRLRWLLVTFAIAFMIHSSVMPFLMPVLIRGRLERLQTEIDDDGICLQTTGYTCGPAASVTALRQVGIDAREGQLARWMHTSPTAGTAPDELARAIGERYAARGVRTEYRLFESIDDLPRDRPVLVVINLGWMVDHFVAVLGFEGDDVVVGDPLRGRERWTKDELGKRWRHAGVVITRDQTAR